MKNIIVIEPSGNLYGSEMVLLDIITNCNENKYKFQVVLPPNSQFTKLLKSNNFKTFEILNISSYFNKMISYIKLFKLLVKEKPDLIFVNQAGIQKVVSIIANKLKIPVVSEVSTLEDGLLVNKFNPKLFDSVKSFICNSEFISNKLEVTNKKKSVLYYGYEWKNLTPIVSESTDPFNVALLGRISESKGHFLLVDAVKDFVRKNPQINIMVYFIGNAPNNDILNNIKQKISDYGLTDRFVFREFNADINSELNNMNLMVIPSIQEPFGRIFCETAEAKLPCLVADTGGLGELSKKFNLGVRFKGRNSLELSNQLLYCYNNYKDIKQDFEAGAHNFLNRLNKDEYIKAIEYILDEAIETKDVSKNWFGTN